LGLALVLALVADVSDSPTEIRLPKDKVVKMGALSGLKDAQLGLRLAKEAGVPTLLYFRWEW